jgi:hypothetical protein
MGIEQRAADGESNGTWHGANLQRHYGQPERGEKVLVYLASRLCKTSWPYKVQNVVAGNSSHPVI